MWFNTNIHMTNFHSHIALADHHRSALSRHHSFDDNHVPGLGILYQSSLSPKAILLVHPKMSLRFILARFRCRFPVVTRHRGIVPLTDPFLYFSDANPLPFRPGLLALCNPPPFPTQLCIYRVSLMQYCRSRSTWYAASEHYYPSDSSRPAPSPPSRGSRSPLWAARRAPDSRSRKPQRQNCSHLLPRPRQHMR